MHDRDAAEWIAPPPSSPARADRVFRYDGDAHERFTTLIEALVEPPRTPESSISDAEGRTLAEAHPTHACSSCEGAETRCRPWIPTVAGLRRLSREARGFAC